MRVKKGATVGSDHYLVVGSLKLKLKKIWTERPQGRERFDTTLLKDPAKKNEFQLTLSNRFQALVDLPDEPSVEDIWTSYKTATVQTCREV